jgi:tetratricopeptide (TPR) repeat protein
MLVLLVACNPQNKLMKQARTHSDAGMYEDAANLYYNILLDNSKNRDAKAGLQANGQKVLADKFAKFSKLVIDGQIAEALKVYSYAQGYARNAAKVGVQLDWPHEYDEVYEDIKQEHIQTQYDLAINLIGNRKYEQAEKVFEQIAVYDSSYKNVSVLRLNTVLEPLYNKALKQYKAGQFKDAYYSFNRVTQIDDQYKDALKLRNLSQQQATQLVGILPVYYKNQGKEFERYNYNIAVKVANVLSGQQGAYVRVANAGALHKDLENRGFININSTEAAIEAGKNTNMAYVALVSIDTFGYNKSKPQVYERDAYEAVTENILNPYTQTYSSISKFKKAVYTDKTEGQHLLIAVTYKLINVRNASVILTDTIVVHKHDELHAATYNGNPANLYPALPEGNYLPHVPEEWRERFVNPRKNLVPLNAFIEMAADEITEKIARKIRSGL